MEVELADPQDTRYRLIHDEGASINHRIGRSLFALIVGLAVAVFAFQWITNPEPRAERALEETAVKAARSLLADKVGVDALEIVDPLAPDRKVGKVYIYSEAPGWAVSGYYRRAANDAWHPYLMTMTQDGELLRLKAQDPELADKASNDPMLEVTR